VVNDRLDVALACGAAGVHLRGDSIDVAQARAIVPKGFWIGRSVHTAAEAAAGDDADYLIAGTVWPTASKAPGAPLLGAAGLAEIVRTTRVPVLAIGGLSLDNLAQVARAGAAGLAAIGLFLGPVDGTGCRAMPLANLVETIRARFDTAR
jgi:thiamine-phosphate pyrophosphorylase